MLLELKYFHHVGVLKYDFIIEFLMTKTIMVLVIAAAFVAGSIGTGTISYAQQGGQGTNLIVDALNNIVSAISGIDPDVTVNVPPAEVQIVGVEGPEGPQGPTGIGCSIVGTFVKCGDLGSDVQGPQGDQGPQGSPGPAFPDTYLISEHITFGVGGSTGNIIRSCDFGDTMLAGGYAAAENVDVRINRPSSNAWTWHALSDFPETDFFIIYYSCADTSEPPHTP